MKHAFALAIAAASLVATPLVAGPPAKRPSCQVTKAPTRDTKRSVPCRKQSIPPFLDPIPMFLVSTGAAPVVLSDLS